MSESTKEIESKLAATSDPRLKVELLVSLAEKLTNSEPRRALECSVEASRIARELSYQQGLAAALHLASRQYFSFAEYDNALSKAGEALEIFERLGDVRGQAECKNTIGAAHLRRGLYLEALDILMSSVSLARSAGAVPAEASSLNILGNIYIEYGDFDAALDHYLRSCRLLEKNNEPIGSNLINNIGVVLDRMGDRRNALKHFLQAVDLARREKNRMLEALYLKNAGEILESLGEYKDALDLVEQSLQIARAESFERIEALALMVIGTTCLSMQQHGQARGALSEGLDIARKIGDRYAEQRLVKCLGQAALAAGEHEKAVDYLRQSLWLAEEQKTISEQASCHEALAATFEKMNDHRSALHHYRKYHELEEKLFNEGSDKKRQLLMVQFQVERAEKETEIQRLKNVELADALRTVERQKLDLESAMASIKTLRGLIPICANCKKIRNDKGYWEQVELYISQHSDAKFTHGICDECLKSLYPDHFDAIMKRRVEASGRDSSGA